MSSLSKTIEIPQINTEKGGMNILEITKDIPFEVKRVYYVYDTKPDAIRGAHALNNQSQIVVAITGSCEAHLTNGQDKETVVLDNPNKGLLIESMIWREFKNFAPGTVLLSITSDVYRQEDYIKNFEDYIKEINNETKNF